jgi:hypothetical protein
VAQLVKALRDKPEVAVSIPDGVIEIFCCLDHSGHRNGGKG